MVTCGLNQVESIGTQEESNPSVYQQNYMLVWDVESLRGNEPHTRGALTCANILMSDQESARIFYALSPQLRHTTK